MMKKPDEKPSGAESESQPGAAEFGVYYLEDLSKELGVTICIDKTLFSPDISGGALKDAEKNLGTALKFLEWEKVRKLKSLIISNSFVFGDNMVLDYRWTSDEMFDAIVAVLKELELAEPVGKPSEPEPTQTPQPAPTKSNSPKKVPIAPQVPAPSEPAEPEPTAVAVEPSEKKDIEEGESAALLRDSNPAMYEKFVQTEKWKQGDAQSRDALARGLLEMGAKLAKGSPEKSKRQDYTKRLAEKFPGIYRKLEDAKGWDRLHPDTREYIAAGFVNALEGTDSAWVARIFEEKYKGIIFDITATSEQLRQPDKIRISTYKKMSDTLTNLGKDVTADKNGNITIPVFFAKDADSDDVLTARFNNAFFKLIPEEYAPEWSAGRLGELQNHKKYPGVYEKLRSAEHWDELNQETKDMLAEAFLFFLNQHPNRLAWVGEGARGFSILLTDDARESMRKGSPLLLERVMYIQKTGADAPLTAILVVASADAVTELLHSAGGYKFSSRQKYLQHAVEVLRGLRPKEKEQA